MAWNGYRSRTIFWSIRGTAKKIPRTWPSPPQSIAWPRNTRHLAKILLRRQDGGRSGKKDVIQENGEFTKKYVDSWSLQDDSCGSRLQRWFLQGDFCESRLFFSHDLTPSLRWFGQSKTEDVNSEWQQDSVRCSHPSLTASLKQLLLQPHATNTLWWAWARKDPPFVDERFIEHWLVGGLEHLVIFPYIGNFMIPTDELIFSEGVVLPATRLS